MKQLLIICLALLFANSTGATDAEKDKTSPPIDVFIEEIKTQDLFDSLVFGGFVEPDASYDIGSEMAGNLHKLHVRLGQRVKKGEVLFEILPASSGFEYQINRVESPISGVISGINKKIGNWVKKGDRIITVSDNTVLKTMIHVTYDDLPYLDSDTPITVSMDFSSRHKEKTTHARIESVSPKADEITGTFPVELILTCNGDEKIRCAETFRLGALLKVTIKKNFRKGIKVPLVYLHNRRKKILTIDDDSRARWIDIQTGNYYGKYVEVIQGLLNGMKVVKGFSKKPDEGDVLKVIEEKPSSS